MANETKKVRITYSTSFIGVQGDQKDTIRRLGFTKLQQTVEQLDTPGHSWDDPQGASPGDCGRNRRITPDLTTETAFVGHSSIWSEEP